MIELASPETRPAPVEVRPKTPREVGEHAARYIEEHGWWPRDYFVGAACASNAIVRVSDDAFGPAHEALLRVIGRDPSDPSGIFDWNDAPERTEAEVLAALRAIR